jgi:sulfatase maturation enzyme AslB (radical SAM superfamily)
MEGKKQTAVEWLVEKMKTYNMTVSVHNTSHENVMDFYKAIEQAKRMEKEIICTAYLDGIDDEYTTSEQYYNKTYGKDKSET